VDTRSLGLLPSTKKAQSWPTIQEEREMPSTLNDLCIGQYQAAMIVLTRLDGDCVPQTGDTDQSRSACFASVDAQPQYDEGQEFGRRAANGNRCFYVRDCDKFKQIDLTLQLITWDMELIELATSSDLILGGGSTPWSGDTIGFALPGTDADCPAGASLEVYTKVAFGTGGFCAPAAAGAPSYIRHLFPFTQLRMGQITFDDNTDGILLNLQGFGLANPNWGNGPNDDWEGSTDVPASTPYAAVFSNTLPDAACGYVAPSE
jgi:hypothetical protein